MIEKSGYKIIRNSKRKFDFDPEFEKFMSLPGFLSVNAFRLFSCLNRFLANEKELQSLPVLEIGIYCGRSLVALSYLFKTVKVVGMDPFYESFFDSPAFPEEAQYLASRSLNSLSSTRIGSIKLLANKLGLQAS
jgi:hypothetical protein